MPVTDAELQAYVDGRLAETRCQAVEAYLSGHPAAAAQVMADMSATRALRAALDAGQEPPSARVRAKARQLSSALDERGRKTRLSMALVLGVIVLGGLGVSMTSPGLRPVPAPEFVDEAVMSRRTALVRASMASQPEVLRLDRQEISSALSIVLPDLPHSWRLTDAQVFPSDEGPSLGLTFDSPDLGKVSLFAVRTRRAASISPTTLERDGGTIAYWQKGELAYALMAPAKAKVMAATARKLAAAPASRAS